ncbi:hypothetical protein GMST_23010 [Geomonas silvestris]|uniref:DUF4136 domain-containing protein n=1 Tax=Geomonas silvestris TaxID=2740184 RepID=A0A6V8MJ43_9BACT|nr:DUF4136 domain-containing protein [Geomonas silvestris]GFO59976.1 hypothetical protein GMST_23010 [Geomonas silvestris]
MHRSLKIAGLLFLAALTLCSCSSISVVQTWRNPTLHPPRLHKILVVSITKKDVNRPVYEDVLAGELAKHGIAAVPSHTLIPSGERSGRDALDRAVKKSGADSVLTLQTIKVERQTTVEPGLVNPYPGYWYPEAFPAWDLYGYYGSMPGPTYISTFDIATMQVNIFDTVTGKLIWAATVTSSEPGNVISVAKDVGNMVYEALAKEQLL